MSEQTPEIRHSVFIRAARDKVWTALTTAQGVDGWWGTRGSDVDLRPGGRITLRWRDWGAEKNVNKDRECVVVEVLAPRRLVFQWRDSDDPMTTVEFELEDSDDGTLVRVREHGFPPTAKGRSLFEGNSLGWGQSLILLKFFVEHGVRY